MYTNPIQNKPADMEANLISMKEQHESSQQNHAHHDKHSNNQNTAKVIVTSLGHALLY